MGYAFKVYSEDVQFEFRTIGVSSITKNQDPKLSAVTEWF